MNNHQCVRKPVLYAHHHFLIKTMHRAAEKRVPELAIFHNQFLSRTKKVSDDALLLCCNLDCFFDHLRVDSVVAYQVQENFRRDKLILRARRFQHHSQNEAQVRWICHHYITLANQSSGKSLGENQHTCKCFLWEALLISCFFCLLVFFVFWFSCLAQFALFAIILILM